MIALILETLMCDAVVNETKIDASRARSATPICFVPYKYTKIALCPSWWQGFYSASAWASVAVFSSHFRVSKSEFCKEKRSTMRPSMRCNCLLCPIRTFMT